MNQAARMNYLRQGFQTVGQMAFGMGRSHHWARGVLARHAREGRRIEFAPPGSDAATCEMFRMNTIPEYTYRRCTAAKDYGHPCADIACQDCQDFYFPGQAAEA